MLGIGFWEWVVIFSILMLLFGHGRISSLAEELGKSIKAFKKGMQAFDKEDIKLKSKNSDHIKVKVDKRTRR